MKSSFFGGIEIPDPKPKTSRDLPSRPRRRIRRYDAASSSNLTADWVTSSRSANSEILQYLTILIARSRDVFSNFDYLRGYLNRLETNLMPPQALHMGFAFQSKAKNPDGTLDEFANAMIEAEWGEFCKPANCSVRRCESMRDILGIAAKSLARDGNALIRKVRGFGNPHRYALQALDIEYLPFSQTWEYYANGHKIYGGIEVDKWYSPVAYHVANEHPMGDIYTFHGVNYQRIPADQIIHLFYRERAQQLFGIPWITASAIRSRMLYKFEEAAMVAARAGASKMGFFKTVEGASYTGDDLTGDDEDGDGALDELELLQEVTPGALEQLPPGVDFAAFDPGYPNTSFAEFCKHHLRGMAAGLNMSYPNFGADLSEASYSSQREGTLQERDMWLAMQGFMITHALIPVFGEWLEIQIASGKIPLPYSKLSKFNAPSFKGKRWAWIDPLKEAEAKKLMKEMGADTLGDIVEESGKDFEETVDRMNREIEYLSKTIFGGDREAALKYYFGLKEDAGSNQVQKNSAPGAEERRLRAVNG